MHDVFNELSLVIVVTVIVSIVMRLLRQPLILGYILAGLLVGPSMLGLIHSTELFQAYSSLGITLLLFIIGLGMNVSELKKLGRVVFLTTLASLVTIGTLGFAASTAMGFTRSEAIIMGLALFFSSTIIIVKILSDKREQNRLHGQIAIGVILLEDVVATFALLFLVAGEEGELQVAEFTGLFIKSLLLIAFLILCSTKILPRFSKYIASSQELLFLFAIGWGFGIASLFERAGFSIEVGALFGGVALASSPYAQEIAARLKPLRDFFVVLFFITLGESLNVTNLASGIGPAIVLSLIVMVLKPFTITSVMGLLGYTKRVSFKAGINLSQISEFSIVLVVLGTSAGLVRPEISAVITLVAIITIASSTYLMQYDEQLFAKFDKLKIRVFEKETSYREKRLGVTYPLVLFGYQRGGHEFIKTFEQLDKRYIVVDYNPGVVEILEHQNIPYIYGDATDVELLDEINIESAKLVISTFTDTEVTLQLVKNVNRINPAAIIICHADNQEQALELYDSGATYVMISHNVGNEKITSLIKRVGIKKSEFNHFRDKEIETLRPAEGHSAGE